MTHSRFITAAFSGITTDRNITISSSTEMPTTKPITSQIRVARMSAMSLNITDEPGQLDAVGQLGPQVGDLPGHPLVVVAQHGLGRDECDRAVRRDHRRG